MQEKSRNPQKFTLHSISRAQLMLTGLTAASLAGVDIATHAGPTGLVVSGLGLIFVGGMSQDIIHFLIPGSDAEGVRDATAQVVDALAPDKEEPYRDQSPQAKLKRLFGIKTPPLAQPKQAVEDVPACSDEDEAPDQQESHPDQLRLPQAPAFQEMCKLIARGRLVLCWTEQGPLYGTVEDLLSMLIIGKPGRGKTTALVYYVAMLLASGAVVHVWDPHGSLSGLDGIARLSYTDDLEDLPASIAELRAELEERRLLYKQIKDRIKEVKPPLLLLVDELPVIGEFNKTLLKRGMDEEQTPVKLISDFVLQARKWNCYFIGAGQSSDAEILPTRVTENLSSRIVFYSSNRRATMAGIDLETAKRFLPLIKPDDVKGRMIFDCSRMSEPILGAIPSINFEDLQEFLGVDMREQSVKPRPALPEQMGVPYLRPVPMHAAEREDFRPVSREHPGREATGHVAKVRPSALPPKLQRAYDAFQDGMSGHQLARVLDVTHPTALSYIRELEIRRLIVDRRKVVNQ